MTLRRAGSALLVLALIGATQVRAQSSTPEFADWTAATAGTATGTLLGHEITLSGPQVSGTFSTVDGKQTLFGSSSFTPPLATSDSVYVTGMAQTETYRLTFGAPVKDPVLDLASFASTIDLPSGTAVTKVSGDDRLSVSDNHIVGTTSGNIDGNGTVRISGTFSSLSFDLTYAPASQGDGIYLQVAATAPPPPATPTATPTPTATSAPTQTAVDGVRVATTVASGQVLVQTLQGFVPLGSTAPVGAVIDARKGSLVVAMASGDSATLAAGIFRIKQQGTDPTTFELVTPPGQARACATRRKGVVRTLSLSAKGVFRTVGAKSVTTGRNATWTTADRCDGTLTRVRRGHVSVRSARRTVKLSAGQSYLVKARLFAAKQRS